MNTTQIRMIKEVRTPIAKAIWNKPSIPQAAAKAAYLSHSLAQTSRKPCIVTFSRENPVVTFSVLSSVGIHAIIGISGPSCRHRDGDPYELKSFFVYEYLWGVSRQLSKPRGWDVEKRSRQWEPVYIDTCVCVCICLCICKYIFIYIHTHIHKYIH